MKVYSIKKERVNELKASLLNMGLISNIDGTLYYKNN